VTLNCCPTARTLDLSNLVTTFVRSGRTHPRATSEPIIFHLDNINGFIEPALNQPRPAKSGWVHRGGSRVMCRGSVDAIATAPINKRSLFLGGYTFPVILSFLPISPAPKNLRCFFAANLRIVLISTHVPLAEAIRMVERDRIIRTVNLTHRELQRWGIEGPAIGGCGL